RSGFGAMFLCRSGRLSAAALDPALRSAGSLVLRVRASGPGHVTVTVQGHRCVCAAAPGAVDPAAALAHLRKRRPDAQPLHSRDSTFGCVIAQGGHLEPAAPVLYGPVQRGAAGGAGGGGGHVLFTGNRWVSSRRCSAGAMQTRAASSTAKRSEEQAADSNNKGEEQNLKEASPKSSSTINAPGEPEPEGGKPNKTQQLKKVFKEYGAVGVSFHIGISLMSLGMFYLLISSGIDMTALLCKLGFSEAVVRSKMAAGTSTFVLAYAIHKLFAPVRISITLVSVPLILIPQFFFLTLGITGATLYLIRLARGPHV
ncbi:hypothetical protein L3Q82_024707, partial [Scortum barcoo]